MLNVKTGIIEKEFHHYIKPDVHPILSEFCTELTGITQDTIDKNGITLAEAMRLQETWLREAGLVPLTAGGNDGLLMKKQPPQPSTYLYLTGGDWDLGTCLPRQLRYHGEHAPSSYWYWINIKQEFGWFYNTPTTRGMVSLLNHLGLELQGRHHSGIDDCRTIARICQRTLHEGWNPTATSYLSPHYR